ncbi:transporter belonging to the MFS superfamily [Thalassiosira pseudonana CCMP1335]|uniref:Lysosomal dipeptide transporter MFSD1 n=1 Tax=Thalassiosira pseudonana TaxID=35128 RepID=B8C2D2_THAPS|nr:transporter belonging to the MFS superfamily [Thalassiosira pseudonana CCMP1335]EED91930.1 transporter belonging to the MFS superfamily [Thalassiosira pseudonana CCMP1335]
MAESNETVASLDVDTPLHQQDSGDEDDDILRQTTQPAAVNTISKSSLRSRWLVLGLTCVVMTGSYYAYDIPSALHEQLQEYMPQSASFETRFNLLYTVYSIPNVILPLFGGNFVDRFGAPRCLALFAFTVFCGSVLLSIGVANKSWHLMYFGRFTFGLGAESLCVAQSTITSEWFEGKEVAFAMGIGLSVSRLGSIWNNIVSPKVANSANIEISFWIGAVLTLVSLLLAGVIVLVDRKATKKIKRRTELASNACTAPETVHITDVKRFGPLFWLLTLSCFVVYGCVLPFNNVASGILLERSYFSASPDKFMSIPYLISALSSPLLGHLVDKIGRRAQLATLSSGLLVLVHLALATSQFSPVVPLIGQGIAYSLYASVLWPSVPLTVAKQYTGTAFGVITSIQNIGLALFPLMIAAIYNASGQQYIPNVELFFVSCATAGLIVGLTMIQLDRRSGKKLYASLSSLDKGKADRVKAKENVREQGDDFEDVDDEQYFSPLVRSGKVA